MVELDATVFVIIIAAAIGLVILLGLLVIVLCAGYLLFRYLNRSVNIHSEDEDVNSHLLGKTFTAVEEELDGWSERPRKGRSDKRYYSDSKLDSSVSSQSRVVIVEDDYDGSARFSPVNSLSSKRSSVIVEWHKARESTIIEDYPDTGGKQNDADEPDALLQPDEDTESKDLDQILETPFSGREQEQVDTVPSKEVEQTGFMFKEGQKVWVLTKQASDSPFASHEDKKKKQISLSSSGKNQDIQLTNENTARKEHKASASDSTKTGDIEHGFDALTADRMQTEKSKETQKTDTLKESKGTDDLKESEGGDDLKETKGGDALKESEGGDTLKETEGGDALKETERGDGLKETEGGDALKESEGSGVDVLIKSEGVDALKESEGVDDLKESEGGDVLKDIELADIFEDPELADLLQETKGDDGFKKAKRQKVEKKSSQSQDTTKADANERKVGKIGQYSLSKDDPEAALSTEATLNITSKREAVVELRKPIKKILDQSAYKEHLINEMNKVQMTIDSLGPSPNTTAF